MKKKKTEKEKKKEKKKKRKKVSWFNHNLEHTSRGIDSDNAYRPVRAF